MPDSTIAQSASKTPKSKILAMTPTLSAALHKMNQELVFVRDLGEIATIPTLERPLVRIHHPAVIVNAIYSNKRCEGALVAKEWMRWTERREVYRLTYLPGKPRFIDDCLNTWIPSLIEPRKGDLSLWEKYLDHIFKSDSTYREWFIHWLAYPLQNPGAKMHTACVFWSTQTATGKSTLGYLMGHLYGQSNFSEITDSQLHNNFNPWAASKQFIMGEEIKGSGSQRNADYIKSIITRKTVTINTKNTPHYDLPDCINYYFTSNHPEAFYLDPSDRRFFVHELGNDRFDPHYSTSVFVPWLERGGYSAILHHLLKEVELSKPIIGGNPISTSPSPFNPYASAPQSRARKEMIEAGRNEAEIWCEELKDNPIGALSGNAWTLATAEELYKLFRDANPGTRILQKPFTTHLKRTHRMVRGGNYVTLANGRKVRPYGLLNDGDAYVGNTEEQVASAYEAERE